MIVPENRLAMAPRDWEESMNSTIIHSLLCPKSATVISDICTGQVHIVHRNLVQKLIPMPQAVEIPAATAAVDEEWEKLQKIPA